MDAALTAWINSFAGHHPTLDVCMVWLANWGIYVVIALTAALWWYGHDRLQSRHSCIEAALAFLASMALNQVILLFVHRIRPYDAGLTHLLLLPNPDWSFPSDHATAVSAICVSLWFRHMRKPLLVIGMVAALVCVSRIFVGVHYAGDVVGGMLIGALVAGVVNWLYRPEAWPFRRLVKLL